MIKVWLIYSCNLPTLICFVYFSSHNAKLFFTHDIRIQLKFNYHVAIGQAIIKKYPFLKDKTAGSGKSTYFYTSYIQLCDKWDSKQIMETAMHHMTIHTVLLFYFIGLLGCTSTWKIQKWTKTIKDPDVVPRIKNIYKRGHCVVKNACMQWTVLHIAISVI